MIEEYFGAEKKRYETRGINAKLPLEYRFLLWMFIDEMEVTKDYLQIFTFQMIKEDGKVMQEIVHTQEVPEYSNTYVLSVADTNVSGKAYCIDDGEQITMLWAEEY